MVKPPEAKKIPHKLEKHGDVRVDDYFWMKERDTKDVLDYLKAENEYTDKVMADTGKFQEKLYAEMRSRIKEDDSTVPFKYGNYYYYKRYETGLEYPFYMRKDPAGKEEVILNVNELAKGREFCSVRFPSVRPDHKMIAYGADFTGRRFYTIYFKDLVTGKTLEEKIENTAGNMTWANDNKTLFYVKQDSRTLRWDRFLSHELGSPAADKEIYYEADETFSLYVSKAITDKYIFLNSQTTLFTEVRYASAEGGSAVFRVFYPREKGLEYSVEDGGDVFYILHNRDAKNFKVSSVSRENTDVKNWKDFLPHSAEALIESMEVFKDWFIVQERKNALAGFKVINRKNGESFYIDFPDRAYAVYPGENMEYESGVFRYHYESMVTPPSVYDFDLEIRKSSLLKRDEVPGYDISRYATERLWFAARDGARVPVTLVYDKKFPENSVKKLFVYGYGSYGYSLDADFGPNTFSLLDRGFAYARIHIRGGSDLGRKWYEDGRQLAKKNTFNDFIDGTRFLIEKGYGSAGHVYAAGGSAGGLLVGAVSNMANELYKGIIAQVPFVDVITTMLDDSIPLTTGEYDEWGNPNVKEYYDYMKSYSPYDNVEKKPYPNMLITSGYHDSQVQYWEPTKWTAKLRDFNTGKSLMLLKTDMSTGHGGKTGRFEYLKEKALIFAFVFKLEGIDK